MFNIGFSEMLVIGILALIFIGPKQLPDVARTLAKLINELKRALNDVTGDVNKNKVNVDDWMKDLTAQISNAGQVKPVTPQTPQVPQAEPERKEMASAIIQEKKKDS